MIRLRADDRGLAVQVGVTILLGFIVIALATYQVQVVPGQNARVEFGHSQTVQGQLQDVRGAIVSVPGGGTGRSVTVSLGTTYPERALFVNPPAPSGQLRTTELGNVTIENVQVRGDDEAGDFWTNTIRNVSTGALVYQPNYNVYQNGPTTVVENTVVFDEQPRSDATVIDSDQRLIDGRRINIVALQGDYQNAGSGTVSVDVDPVSTSTRTVTLTDNGSNVTITVPTRLNASIWENELLDDEENVVSVTDAGGDRIEIELAGNTTYELRMAKVGVGSDVEEEDPAYVTVVDGDGSAVTEGTNRTLVVEVRDRFNNPVSGVDVNFSSDRGANVSAQFDDTDADGQVKIEYEAPDVPGTTEDRVNVSFTLGDTETNQSTFDGNTPENVTIELDVVDSDSGGGGGGGDTTPPTVNSLSATAKDTDMNNKNIEEIEFAYDVSDGDSGISEVVFKATDDMGTTEMTTETATSGTVNLPFNKNLQGPNKYVDVTVTITDNAGNTRTCSGRLGNVSETISRNDGISCS